MSTPSTDQKRPPSGSLLPRVRESSLVCFSATCFLQFDKDPAIPAKIFILAIDSDFCTVGPFPAEGGPVVNPPFHQNQRFEAKMPIPAKIPIEVHPDINLRVMGFFRDILASDSGKNQMTMVDPDL